MPLWDAVFDEVAAEFPQITTDSCLVDALVARVVRDPASLDVVVASNLFGDILTDLGAAIAGSMGLAPSANLDPSRRNPSLFQAIHGSAPDIAGRGIANPIAEIWSAAMLLDFTGEFDGMEGGAVWQDMRMGVREWSAWERIALVTDHAWMRDGLSMFAWAVPGEVRAFPSDQRQTAVDWLAGH